MRLKAGLAGLLLALAGPAQAQDGNRQERVEIDTNVICNTQQQVERFLALFDSSQGSVEAAMDSTNAEQSTPAACVLATTAHRRDGQVSTVRSAEATFDVTRITVVGVYTINGLERAQPTAFFTPVARGEEAGTVGQR